MSMHKQRGWQDVSAVRIGHTIDLEIDIVKHENSFTRHSYSAFIQSALFFLNAFLHLCRCKCVLLK